MKGVLTPALVLVFGVAVPASAQVPPTHYELSPDVPLAVGTLTPADGDVVDLDAGTGGWSSLAALSAILPPGVGVDAVQCYTNGDVVFSPDSAFSWPGGSAGDEDVVLDSAGTLSLLFDGSAAGIPPGVGVDAVTVSRWTPLELLLSVDTDTTLGGVSVTDDDIVRFNAPSSFVVVIPGSSWLGSEASRADLDGLAVEPGTSLVFVSLDVSVALGSLTADDEDVVRLVNGNPTQVLDLSSLGFPGAGGDVDALDIQVPPELSSGTAGFGIVNTATPVTWTVDYTDRDGDGPAVGSPSFVLDGGTPTAMTQIAPCGSWWCDGEYTNGERFQVTATVAHGAAHQWTVDASDGVDAAAQFAGTGPSYVSAPGDADGDTDRDAGDLSVILIENADTNGGSNLDLVRSGMFTSSWGGTDADSDHQVTAVDIPAALAWIY